MSRIALDTNILAYLAGVTRNTDDHSKVERTRQLIDRLALQVRLVAPVQALGELFVVLLRAGSPREQARSLMIDFASAFATAPSLPSTALAAADLAVDHQLQFWDSIIVCAAADAGCTLLLSEDMQHGFVTRGLTVVNPLSDSPDERLEALIGPESES